jgi:hypothetical protein
MKDEISKNSNSKDKNVKNTKNANLKDENAKNNDVKDVENPRMTSN